MSALVSGTWYLLTARTLSVPLSVLLGELALGGCYLAQRAQSRKERDQLTAAFQRPALGEDAGPTPHRPPADGHDTGTVSD
ncbi:hypothetical protein [Streptomyces sp. NPDC059783]|uniref:hypothetical protein n=1 Tax=Streptomyces sp. NPDC059783 TaxID=3346944 RepID=UPI003651AB52